VVRQYIENIDISLYIDISYIDIRINIDFFRLLPRCMQCRRGLAMRKLSVRLSVRLLNVWSVTKRKNDLS